MIVEMKLVQKTETKAKYTSDNKLYSNESNYVLRIPVDKNNPPAKFIKIDIITVGRDFETKKYWEIDRDEKGRRT